MRNCLSYRKTSRSVSSSLLGLPVLLLAVITLAPGASASVTLLTDETVQKEALDKSVPAQIFLAASFRSDRIYVLLPHNTEANPAYDPKSIEYLGSHGGIHWLTARPDSELSQKARGLLGAVGSGWQLWSGPDRIGDVELGEPVVLARIVPHFGVVQEWEESPLESPTRSAQTRQDLMSNSEVVLAFPVEGDAGKAGLGNYDEVLWVRHAIGFPATMAQAEEIPVAKAPWFKWTSELPDWVKAADRVTEAFRNSGADAKQADATASYAWKVEIPPREAGAAPMAFGVAALTLGDTLCGQGPDEASILAVWRLLADESKGEFIGSIPTEGDPIATPRLLVVGDMDGDGLVEVVVRGELITNTKTIYRLMDNKLVPVKSDYITFADCPC